MIAIVTILLAFPLGLLLRSRSTALVGYAVVYLWSYTFQTAYLTRSWVDLNPAAGFNHPADLGIDYGLVTGGIFLVGFGLVALGHRVASRRRDRHEGADLDAVVRT